MKKIDTWYTWCTWHTWYKCYICYVFVEGHSVHLQNFPLWYRAKHLCCLQGNHDPHIEEQIWSPKDTTPSILYLEAYMPHLIAFKSLKLYKYLMAFKPLKIKRKLSLKLFTINGPVMSTCLTQRLNWLLYLWH